MTIRVWLAGLGLCLLAACQGDETISGYSDTDTIWRLIELDDAPFNATATIRFPEEGVVGGQGPCNVFSANQTEPYPWINIGPILSTKRACADLDQETRFFTALSEMTLAEATPAVLILSTEDGRKMIFEADGGDATAAD